MKTKFSLLLIIVAGFCFPLSLSAQKDTVINGIHYKADKNKNPEFTKTHKRLTPIDSEFVINNKKFRYYNKWFTIGGGAHQNVTYARELGFAGGADLNFHIKRNYYQTGLEITGVSYNFYTNYQFHFGYGWRFEDRDVHFAAFVGPSYSTGMGLTPGDTSNIYNRKYSHVGLYLQTEIVKKIAFDVGIGASLFADWNQEQTIVGFRGILYFSGSYRGEKLKRPAAEQ